MPAAILAAILGASVAGATGSWSPYKIDSAGLSLRAPSGLKVSISSLSETGDFCSMRLVEAYDPSRGSSGDESGEGTVFWIDVVNERCRGGAVPSSIKEIGAPFERGGAPETLVGYERLGGLDAVESLFKDSRGARRTVSVLRGGCLYSFSFASEKPTPIEKRLRSSVAFSADLPKVCRVAARPR